MADVTVRADREDLLLLASELRSAIVALNECESGKLAVRPNVVDNAGLVKRRAGDDDNVAENEALTLLPLLLLLLSLLRLPLMLLPFPFCGLRASEGRTGMLELEELLRSVLLTLRCGERERDLGRVCDVAEKGDDDTDDDGGDDDDDDAKGGDGEEVEEESFEAVRATRSGRRRLGSDLEWTRRAGEEEEEVAVVVLLVVVVLKLVRSMEYMASLGVGK